MRLFLTITACFWLVQIKAQAVLPDSVGERLLNAEYSFWQAQSDSERVQLLTQKAFIYRQKNNYAAAIREIERGVTFLQDSSLTTYQWKYEALMDYFLAHEFEKASMVLENFEAGQAGKINKRNEYFYLRWSVFNELGKWRQCKTEILPVFESSGDTLNAKNLRSLPENFTQKNSVKARRLSAFVPGAGAFYAGYPFKGTVSFIIDGGIVVLATYLAINELYITALVSGALPLLKFYTGNKRLAESLAYRRNLSNELKIKGNYGQFIERAVLILK